MFNFELEEMLSRILFGPPDYSEIMPSVQELIIHELGNEIQLMSLNEAKGDDDWQDAGKLTEEYHRFREGLKNEEPRERAEAIHNLENYRDLETQECENRKKRVEYVKKGLEAAEDYINLLEDDKRGRSNLEEILNVFEVDDNVDLDYNCEDDVEVDDSLWVVINTLKKNSYDHSDKPGSDIEISLTAETYNDETIIEYTDNGGGIPEEEREGLFELGGGDTGLPSAAELVYKEDGFMNYCGNEENWCIEVHLPAKDY